MRIRYPDTSSGNLTVARGYGNLTSITTTTFEMQFICFTSREPRCSERYAKSAHLELETTSSLSDTRGNSASEVLQNCQHLGFRILIYLQTRLGSCLIDIGSMRDGYFKQVEDPRPYMRTGRISAVGMDISDRFQAALGNSTDLGLLRAKQVLKSRETPCKEAAIDMTTVELDLWLLEQRHYSWLCLLREEP
ncbi:hypothetical protein BJ508DRAFT_310911 [Ascobolus immersus RN42]|uniref:Uncharacterized protein n=1 Tax=Ascobolus immersus RN42 TaxID=1160509 RepID=A0A3N4HXA3_ASCIM|nr:hypothetical protein BJ508DRAFT_310911 [Ascobolus immersus RN42]